MKTYEMEHWVLFDTMTSDQINRLKKVIDNRHAVEKPAAATAAAGSGGSFGSILDEEIGKLDRKA